MAMDDLYICGRWTPKNAQRIDYCPLVDYKSTQTTPYRCVHCGRDLPRRRFPMEPNSRQSTASRSNHSIVITDTRNTRQMEKQLKSHLDEWERRKRHCGNQTPSIQVSHEQLQQKTEYNICRNSSEEWVTFSTSLSNLSSASGDDSGERYNLINSTISNSGRTEDPYEDMPPLDDCTPRYKFPCSLPTFNMHRIFEGQLPPPFTNVRKANDSGGKRKFPEEPDHDSSHNSAKLRSLDFYRSRDLIATMVMESVVEHVQGIYRNTLAEHMTIIQHLNKIPKLVKDAILIRTHEKS